jgi:hypothetical protein
LRSALESKVRSHTIWSVASIVGSFSTRYGNSSMTLYPKMKLKVFGHFDPRITLSPGQAGTNAGKR